MVLASSAFSLGRNIQLALAKDYKRLGVNLYGPPGSLFLYDHYMDRNKHSEDEKSGVAAEKSRVGSSLPSKPKTRGNNSPSSYRLKRGRKCAPGYVEIDGFCVRKNSKLAKDLLDIVG